MSKWVDFRFILKKKGKVISMSIFRLGRLIKSQTETLYIKRGGVRSYKVAVDSDGNPQSFQGIIGTKSVSTEYQERFSTNTPMNNILFTVPVNAITFDGDTGTSTLRKDDKIVRAGQMTRTPAKPSESESDNLKRDITDTNSGVLVIQTDFNNFEERVFQATDINSLGQ